MIPTNARKKFHYNVVPSDRQIWAIGMVVVKWSTIEIFIKAFVHSFTDTEDANDPIRKLFDSTRSLSMRLDQWEELARQHIQPGWLQPMLALINETKQLADMRDKIVHGSWSDKQNSETRSEEAYGPFSWGNPGHPFNWKLDYGGIMQVARRIDELQNQMFQYALKASPSGNTGGDFRFGSALRHIQNAPNHP